MELDTDAIWATLRAAGSSPAAFVIATVLGAAIAGAIVTRILRTGWTRLARHTTTSWDDELSSRLGSPVSAIIAIQLFRAAVPFIRSVAMRAER